MEKMNLTENIITRGKEFLPALLLSLLFAFTLGVYAPLQWFISNRSEFWFDIYDSIPSFLLMFAGWLAAMLLLNLVVFLLFGKRLKTVYRGILLIEAAAYVCIYVEGNFLISALPGLTGADIDWSTGPIRTQQMLTILLWILLITFACIMIKKLDDAAAAAVIRMGFVWFFLLMLIALVGSCFGKWEKILYNRNRDYTVSSENMLLCSEKQNFIILLLDHVDGAQFSALLEKYPEYRETLSDFTYYEDTQGMYAYTNFSVPYILTGKRYENEEEFKKYYVKAMSDSPLLKLLEERGYRLGIYEEDLKYTNQEAKNRLDNLSGHRSYVSSSRALAKIWMKLVGFRYLPYGLKQYSVPELDAVHDLRAKRDIELPDDYSWRNYVFYDILTQEGMTLTDQNCFRFIHLKGGHMEFDTDENVRFSEVHTSAETVLRGCMTLLKEYMRQLRELNAYDQSVIMIMADHGDSTNGSGVHPIFLVKGFGEHHETLEYSEARVSYADLMEIDRALLDGKTGRDILPFDPGEQRARLFLWYKAFNDSKHMVEYEQTGGVEDTDTFLPTGRVYDYQGDN